MNKLLPRGPFVLVVLLTTLFPAFAYDHPLTERDIREAYFPGTGPKGEDPAMYSGYAETLPIPKEGPPVSLLTIDTPYLQVAEHAREMTNYDAQQAVRDFLGKPAKLRVFLDIYFALPKGADPALVGAVKVTLSQHGKKIAPGALERWELNPFTDAATSRKSVGQHVQLDVKAEKIDASDLIITVDTPDGQHAEASFDMSRLK